ncbi:MAG: peptidylprolyl isomerase [Flavobacteriales bacterium]|nr:peptidylprolyl isomerase [Flavobacteriales bacterium]
MKLLVREKLIKRYVLPIIVMVTCLITLSFVLDKSAKKVEVVIISTSFGDMTVRLYDDTPLHKENFLKLTKEGYYDGLLFHRVIQSFMIQGGDPDSRNADPGKALGTGGPGYTIPAEFRPQYIHKKGALSAARQGDAVNPDKESSGSQFYIVQGKVVSSESLTRMVRQKKPNRDGNAFSYTQEQIEAYTEIGGTPHLDGEYTVFGEVIEGLNVIDSIASHKTDGRARPIEDITMKMKITKRKWQ